MTERPIGIGESLESLVGQVADEFLSRQRAGEHPIADEYANRYPAAADVLRPVLASLALLDASRAGGSGPAPGAPGEAAGTLGDFRILREVGRGGMGVVYEAEQISLGRRVALKVLPFASTLDDRQLQRFKNEAQAAAGLHHTNIVPVFATGCERGVHYYAMQFIPGRTLAGVIAEWRGPAGPAAAAPTGSWVPPAAGSTVPQAAVITERASRGSEFFRTAARLGVQAARALEHAHQLGVVHRDVKPANLLVDDRGTLWVTDFGLAHCQNQAGLTMTGDLVGTLRYMSPEQVLAKRVPVDHRTDVYSLGATLYELFTLEPAFGGSDRAQLLRQIAFEEPRRPRSVRRTVPAELEVIVLKAMEKSPADRYATAAELADDLDRFLDGRPIRARRPSVTLRVRKWARRHPAVVWSAVIVAMCALASLAAILQVRRQAALDQADLERQDRERLELSLYARTVSAAEREQATGNVGRAEELLDECPPALRGWEWHYLKRQRFGGRERVDLSTHLYCVAASPDGRWLAAGGSDGTVRLWDPVGWREVGQLVHGAHVRGVAFSPDSRRIASAGDDGRVWIWEVDGRRRIRALSHADGALSVAFSPDGTRLLTGGDGGAFVWDAATGERLHELRGHTDRVLAVAFGLDGKLAATAGEDDRLVKIWDARTWAEVRTLGPHTSPVAGVAFHPDGRHLAAGCGYFFMSGDDCEAKVWDVDTGEAGPPLRGHQGSVLGLAFSPDGRRLVTSGSEDATIKVWDVATGLELLTLRGHHDAIFSLAFGPDGRRLYSVGADHTLREWDGTPVDGDGKALRTFTGHPKRVTSVAIDRDGHRLASGCMDGAVRVWDLPTGRLLQQMDGVGAPVHGVAFDPGGDLLAAASWPTPAAGPAGRPVRAWNTRTWAEQPIVPPDPDAGCVAVAFRPAGGLVAADGGTLWVFDGPKFRASPVTYRHEAVLTSVAIRRDGRHAAAADVNGDVWVWDLADPRPALAVFAGPDLAGLGNLNAALTARPAHRFRAHATRATGIAYSPAADVLATCGMDGAIRFWDAITYQPLGEELRGHVNGVRCLAFSPDGTRLVTGGNDATVRVWDVASRRRVDIRRGHTDVVYGVSFSRDGRYIASGSLDKTVKVWEAPPGDAGR
jgi:WD40 repeat protein/serine/threonine protein kinase